MKKNILAVISIVLGIFFLVSGVGKVLNVQAFAQTFYQYGLPPLAFLAPFIVALEFVLGVRMIMLVQQKRSFLQAAILLAIFTLSFAYGHFIHGVEDCGCFGEIGFLKTPPMVSFIRNFVLLGLAIYAWTQSENAPSTARWKHNVTLVVMAIAFLFSGITISQPISPRVPKADILVSDSELAGAVTTDQDSSYLVFVFSYTCPHCWDATNNIKSYVETGVADKVIAFGAGDEEDRAKYMAQFQPNFDPITMPQEELFAFTDRFPTAFLIQHDSIKSVMRGEIHSPWTLKKNTGLGADRLEAFLKQPAPAPETPETEAQPAEQSTEGTQEEEVAQGESTGAAASPASSSAN